MEKMTISALELNDFPFAGGVFLPQFNSVSIDMATIKNRKIGTTTQATLTKTKLGNDVIPKGAKVISRLQYTVFNHTQDLEGHIELIGVENSRGDMAFFVAIAMSLTSGDRIGVQFDGVALNSETLN